MKTIEFSTGKPPRLPLGANARAEERLVGVDIPNAVQQFLIKQSSFDRSLSAAKELREIFRADGERLSTRSREAFLGSYAQPAKTSRIDEAQLTSRTERGDRMSVFWGFLFGRTDEQASGHAKVNNPLTRAFAFP